MIKRANEEGDFHFSKCRVGRRWSIDRPPVPKTPPHSQPERRAKKKCGRQKKPIPSWLPEKKMNVRQKNETAHPCIPEYITHTLACQSCINAGVAQRCIHNLGNLPPWKSVMKLSQIKRIYPKKQQREFETEILGIPEDSGEGYIDSQLLEALRDKPRLPSRRASGLPKYGSDSTRSATAEAKWALPQSHTRQGAKRSSSVPPQSQQRGQCSSRSKRPSKCSWGACATTRGAPSPQSSQSSNGTDRPDPPATPQPTHATTDPSGRPPGRGGGGNNNEVYAHELVTVFDAFPPLNNPWTRGFFDKNVAPNIGVVSRPGSVPALSRL